jgi:predicted chitinase
MAFRLSRQDWKLIFPRAPDDIIDAFVNDPDSLDAAGITETRTRLSYALANVEHECGGYRIPRLTENINFTAKRLAEVFSNRFNSAAEVTQKYGTAAGWQKAAFDDIYGNRMGNRPGTKDGSTYIGRGGPQITGRDGYKEVGKRCGLDLVNNPELASSPAAQPAILAAFWSWKKLNAKADAGDFIGCVKLWNGGTNGLADRKAHLAGNDPIIQRLTNFTGVAHVLDRVA